MKNRLILTLLVLALTVTGCLTSRVPDVAETTVKYDFMEAQKTEPSNPRLWKEPTPYRETNRQQRHTVTMVDMDLREALAALSRLSDVPIAAEPDVSGKVNIAVEKKTLSEILQVMVRPLGYSAYVERDMIVVAKPRMITRAFYVNYLRAKRTSSSVTSASISSGNSGSFSSTNASGSSGDGGSSGSGDVSVTTSGSSDSWAALREGLNLIVFGGEKVETSNSGKKIIINDMAGVVYVTDTEENMALVGAFIDDVSKELKRQVLIQAHIVEIALDNEFSLGVDWNSVFNSLNTTVSQVFRNPVSNTFTIDINSSDFSLMLDAFKEQGNVNMLSSPKVSAMNNQKAIIKLTTKEVTWVNQTITNTTGETLSTSTTPQIDEVGLFLDVTPNISADGIITMHVHPSISDIESISTAPDGLSNKPVINVREVDTIVDIKSGQTVVIAGLISDRSREVKRSVPLLGDIPYLGLAFSNFHQEHKKIELVIFLTPFVVEAGSAEKIKEQHEERLREMDEISRFVESRSPQGWRSILPGNSSLIMDANEVQPDNSVSETVVVVGEPAVPQEELSPAEQDVDAPLNLSSVPQEVLVPSTPAAPAAHSTQWATPPPQREAATAQ